MLKNESYLVNTNMTWFSWFYTNLCILVLWTKVVLALEGLKGFGNTNLDRWIGPDRWSSLSETMY